jgi:hypothetical protein
MWVGAAGGGVWYTPDALAATPAWQPLDTGITSNAIGSLAVDPNDPTGNTIYAGTGEPNGSGDSEAGVGLFRSTDGGQTWKLMGLYNAGQISGVRIHPTNPNIVWVSAQGDAFKSNAERGVYRCKSSHRNCESA